MKVIALRIPNEALNESNKFRKTLNVLEAAGLVNILEGITPNFTQILIAIDNPEDVVAACNQEGISYS